MNKHEIESLKRIELDILKAFVSVCSQLGIRYYLLGGTLLGAVRHQGFIPWDDDIDVGLLRSDYEIFIKEAPKLLPEYYFVQNLHSEPSCLLNFTKIRDSRTTFIEASTKNRKINHGVFIDVFPLDYYPQTQEEIRHLKKMQKELWYRIYREYTFPKNVQDSLPKEIKKQIISHLLMIKYPSYEKALLKREALYSSFPKSDLIANFCGAWGEKEIVPAEWYDQGVTVSFEGLELIAPTHYDKWLTQVYGNYMELPPVEKRVSHHYTETIDLEKPYIYYIK